MSRSAGRLIGWWLLLLAGAAIALFVAWLGRVVSVHVTTLLTVAAVVVGLTWLILLVAVPWNLCFAARRAVQAMVVSRERGISIREADNIEAGHIASRMLRFALGAHVGTALAAALVALIYGNVIGYYVAGFFLLSTVFRPAAAYFVHVRERIGTLMLESTHPRDDIATLEQKVDGLVEGIDELRNDLRRTNGDLHRAEGAFADGIAHARQLLTTDLARVTEAQATDRATARSRSEGLEHKIDEMVRRIEMTLDGLTDHQELLTGLRALVRMVRADQP